MKWIIDAIYADGSELHTTHDSFLGSDKWADEHSERIAMLMWITDQSNCDCVWCSLKLENE